MTIKYAICLLVPAMVPLLGGCGADEAPAGEGLSAAARPLECQTMGFACT